MSNKIDTAIAAIVTKLVTLQTAGSLANVETDLINPATYAKALPAAGVVLGHFFSEGAEWTAEILVMALTRKAAISADTAVETAKKIDAALKALQLTSGTLGGNLDQLRWDAWYSSGGLRIGAAASMRLRVSEPL